MWIFRGLPRKSTYRETSIPTQRNFKHSCSVLLQPSLPNQSFGRNLARDWDWMYLSCIFQACSDLAIPILKWGEAKPTRASSKERPAKAIWRVSTDINSSWSTSLDTLMWIQLIYLLQLIIYWYLPTCPQDLKGWFSDTTETLTRLDIGAGRCAKPSAGEANLGRSWVNSNYSWEFFVGKNRDDSCQSCSENIIINYTWMLMPKLSNILQGVQFLPQTYHKELIDISRIVKNISYVVCPTAFSRQHRYNEKKLIKLLIQSDWILIITTPKWSQCQHHPNPNKGLVTVADLAILNQGWSKASKIFQSGRKSQQISFTKNSSKIMESVPCFNHLQSHCPARNESSTAINWTQVKSSIEIHDTRCPVQIPKRNQEPKYKSNVCGSLPLPKLTHNGSVVTNPSPTNPPSPTNLMNIDAFHWINCHHLLHKPFGLAAQLIGR